MSADVYTFIVDGPVPSKKNNWKPKAGGGIRTNSRTKRQLEAVIWQLLAKKARYRSDLPLKGKLRVDMSFGIPKRMLARDLDNMATSMLDCLQEAGIIENDRFVMQLSCAKYQMDLPKDKRERARVVDNSEINIYVL